MKSAMILALLFLLPLAPAYAASITVDSDCTFNDAITSANADAAPAGSSCEDGDSGADTIVLSADITLAASPDEITSEVTITGGGYTISGDDTYRILSTNTGADLTVNNLTLTNGKASAVGGAVLVTAGTVEINDATIKDSAASVGGGIGIEDGTVTINNSTISGNTAVQNGGGVSIALADATLTINGSRITGNTANINVAGVYIFRGVVTIRGSSIDSNSTPGNAGGVGIGTLGTLIMENSTVWGNNVGSGAGVGIMNYGDTTLRHITSTANTHGLYFATGSLRLYNSILTGNVTSDCNGQPNMALSTNTNNLISIQKVCGAGSVTGAAELGDRTGSPPYFPLLAGSAAIDAAAESACLPTDQIGTERPQGDACDLGAVESIPPPRAASRAASGSTVAAVPDSPRERRITCQNLPPRIVVTGYSDGTECQVVDDEGIGVAAILQEGYVDALDVWGYWGSGVRVCFARQGGGFIFLDAADAPRSQWQLPAFSLNGMTCGDIDRAGTLVLMPGTPSETVSLSDCMARTLGPLNLRAAPGGDVMRVLPANITLTALERRDDWFRVDYHGERGWVSATHVEEQGQCSA